MVFAIVPLAVVGTILLLVVLFLGRDRVGTASAEVARLYVLLGGFAGVVVAAIGLAWLLSAAIAALFGPPFAYGSSGVLGDVRRQEDLVRGLVFVLFGALFWAVHRLFRVRPAANVRRAYLLLGTLSFGIAVAALVPFGLAEGLLRVAVSPGGGPPPAEPLGAGLAYLPFWILYVIAMLKELRTESTSEMSA